MRAFQMILLAALPALVPSPALAQVAVADSGDTAWLMTCALLLLIAALVGLPLRFAGLVGARNPLSVMAQGAGVAAGVSLAWAVLGYSLAFAPGTQWLGGASNAFLGNLAVLRDGVTVPESVFALFQMAFATLAALLVVGAVAERVRFGWLMWFAPLWTLVVFAPVTRWLWGGGWLAGLGTLDYAGALAVHVAGGASALVVALMIGRRAPDVARSAHAPALSLAGTAALWIGWFGATGGWALGATDDAATAILNTHLSASAAAIAWALVERLRTGRSSATGLASGAVAGLVAISASAGLVGAGGAMAVGAASGIVCQLAASLPRRIGADDVAQVFAVHGVGGAVGALLLVPFISQSFGGVGFEGEVSLPSLLVAQAVGIGTVALWAAVGTAVLGLAISMLLPLRVSADQERDGLDISQHGQQGWDFR